MPIFKKKSQQENAVSKRKLEASSLERQTKWDELERLVAGTGNEETLTRPGQATSPSKPSINEMDFSGKIETGLNADIPERIQSVDVTPSDDTDALNLDELSALMPAENIENGTDSNFVPVPPAITRSDRADLGSMRLDVARISADIQTGEELYRRAQQRIENLTSFVEKAEVDYSTLSRLEPENRRLKARNRTIEREYETQAKKLDVLRQQFEDNERRLSEKTRQYEASISKLSQNQKALQDYERELNNTREASDRNALKAERALTSLEVERKENEHLRTRVSETSAEIEIKQSAFIEARKVADSLAQDCADFRHQAEDAHKDADETRKSLATALTQNNAMKAEMISLHQDIQSFKTQSEFTIISREDELTALQQQVTHLKKQLEIKDDIVRNAARDVTDLRKIRTAQDLERERLEAQVETQAFQLEEVQSELLKTKQDVTDFDRRYRDVATALTVAQNRRMSNEPSETPDIQPMPTSSGPVLAEYEDLSDSDVEDRIMDFRSGLRGDLS